jgi:predicted DNA-binding transcriptional regulator AlpA
MPDNEDDPILLPSEVVKEVRSSRSTIDRARRKGTFPQPILLGERRIGWRRSIIRQWLANRPLAGGK